MTTKLTRRTAMLQAAGLPIAAASLTGASLTAVGMTGAALAQGTDAAAQPDRMMTPDIPPYRRLSLGSLTITTLLAGTRLMENPHETFGQNASDEEFAALSQDNFIPADASLNGFTPVLVETGSETILFDTGLAAEGLLAALAAAGHAPEDVTHVVITHMHGDHIGGLMEGDMPTFPNATYLTGQVEFDHWAAAGSESFEAKVRPLADQFTFLAEGDEVVPGITAVEAFGHTPGMLAFWIESEGERLALTADTANHYVWSLQRPDWVVGFDMDSDMAAATRKRILGRVAEERIPFIGYHMPFPGIGFLQAEDAGFRFVPASYQFNL